MSTPTNFQLDWEPHLEALPVPTWILAYNSKPDVSQWDQLSGRERCGAVFANRACREILGLPDGHTDSVSMQRYIHPEDVLACLDAWDDFLEGRSERFQQTHRWIRPDTKETVTLVVHAQKLLCGDIQGWLRSAKAETALSRLEELANAS